MGKARLTANLENEPVGLVGLGLLGSALAERLLRAGFSVVGYDVDPARCRNHEQLGGHVAGSARGVAASCKRVLLSLPNSKIAAAVVDDLSPLLATGSIVIDTTTGDPEEMTNLARQVAEKGAEYLDATVGGSSQQARDGEVIVIAGGESTTVDSCRDIFAAFAREVFHVGPVGSGARMKLVVNLVLGLNRAVLAEGLAFARASGFDAAETLKILAAGPAYSLAMDMKGRKMIEQEFSPQARLSQHLKDVRLILAAGETNGAKLPLSEVHRRLLEEVERAGFGDADNSAIIRAFE